MHKFKESHDVKKIIAYLLISISILSIGMAINSVDSYWNKYKIVSLADIQKEDEYNTESVENYTKSNDVKKDKNIDYNELFEELQSDLELLKSGDSDIVSKYFGESDILTPDTISDRVSTTNIYLFDSTNSDTNNNGVSNNSDTNTNGVSNSDDTLIVHVCTLDYNKMNNDYIESISDDSSDNVETAKKMITRSLIAGEYDLCYNIPLNIENNSTVINEAFKKAITGGWYDSTDVEINPVECIIASQ